MLKSYIIQIEILLIIIFCVFITGILQLIGCSDENNHLSETPAALVTPTPSPGNITFAKMFGGMKQDIGLSVIQCQNGDYVLAGVTQSYTSGGFDFYLIRTDSYGNERWQWPRAFGGRQDDYCVQVIESQQDGFLLLGSTESFGNGSSDVYLIHTDKNGIYEWSRTYGGQGYDWGSAICRSFDGNYVICGYTNSSTDSDADILLIKIDQDGNVLWSVTYGGDKGDFGYSVCETPDRGFMIVGGTYSFGSGDEDIIVVNTDLQGHERWIKTFGSLDKENAYCIRPTHDGGYIICGEGWSYLNNMYLLRLDNYGDELWAKTYGGDRYEWAWSVRETQDNGYVLCGTSDSYGSGDGDFLLLKTDQMGEVKWLHTFGGTSSETGYTVEQTHDHGFIIIGATDSYGSGDFDFYAIKTDINGIRP